MMKDEILQRLIREGRVEESHIFPKVVLIDTISFCNLRCSMCAHKDMRRKKGVMKWDLLKKIIDEIAIENKDVRVWMVFAGEALILKKKKPTIFEMIKYAKDKGLSDVVLNSNGCLLDSDAAVNLIKSDLDAIYIGIDAIKPETYHKLRVGGIYEQTVNNVINFLKIKRDMNAKKPEVFIQFVEMDINSEEKGDFIKFWTAQGAIAKIRPKVSWAGKIEAPNQILQNDNRLPCHWAMQTITIADNGMVVLCPVDLNADFIAGNINNQTIKDVWNGKLKELREYHRTRDFKKLPELCYNCRDWQSARADYYKGNG